MKPQSNPSYYDDVVREIEEVQTRSWLGDMKKRLSGLVRLS